MLLTYILVEQIQLNVALRKSRSYPSPCQSNPLADAGNILQERERVFELFEFGSVVILNIVERQTFIDLLFQSMWDSARQVRLLLGRPSSRAMREQALRQVEMHQAAKENI